MTDFSLVEIEVHGLMLAFIELNTGSGFRCSKGDKQALSLAIALGVETLERCFDVVFLTRLRDLGAAPWELSLSNP